MVGSEACWGRSAPIRRRSAPRGGRFGDSGGPSRRRGETLALWGGPSALPQGASPYRCELSDLRGETLALQGKPSARWGEASPSRGGRRAPRGEPSAFWCESSALQGESSALRGETPALRSELSARRGGASTSRSGRPAPWGEGLLTWGEPSTRRGGPPATHVVSSEAEGLHARDGGGYLLLSSQSGLLGFTHEILHQALDFVAVKLLCVDTLFTLRLDHDNPGLYIRRES